MQQAKKRFSLLLHDLTSQLTNLDAALDDASQTRGAGSEADGLSNIDVIGHWEIGVPVDEYRDTAQTLNPVLAASSTLLPFSRPARQLREAAGPLIPLNLSSPPPPPALAM
uniref:Mediator of RNA polymerase II transcription subunit 4 n=1 Tax=Mesocestoides corti TaxID=53468 RepID=A0A5K3FZW2_MESCO